MKKRNEKNSSSDKYVEDKNILARVEAFFGSIHHVKGELAGQSLTPESWQWESILRPTFGMVDKATGLRRYRLVYVEIPRKNGKTTVGAGVGLYLTFCDREPGAEVYSAAADRSQAAICFNIAKQMAQDSEMLAERAETFQRSIMDRHSSSSYQVLSADAETKHGFNAHGVVFDELHTQPNRSLWDVLKTSMGARRQPLLFVMTTAGYDRNSVCWEIHQYAIRVAAGLIEDPTFLPILYSADPEVDWKDKEVWQVAMERSGGDPERAEEWAKTRYWTFPSVWRKANPNLNVSVRESYLAAECLTAQETPAYENTFKRLYLNIWTEQSVRWMPMEKWDACDLAPIDLDTLRGCVCFAGLDLASTTDIAALVLLALPLDEEEPYQVLPFFWVPEENVVLRAKRDHVDYREWIRRGLITATEGNVIDQDRIRKDINVLQERFQIREIAIDRWNSTQLQTQLMGDGFTVAQFGQGFASMTAPTKELLGLVLGQRINHGGHPVLRWMASNVAVKQDPAGNLKPDKEKSTEKIDGIVALIMALGRAIVQPIDVGSVYETRGVVRINAEGRINAD